MKNRRDIILYLTLSVVALFFLFYGLVLAKPFLAPFFTAMVLALLMIPIARKLERWGAPRVLASLSSTLILLLVAAGFLTMVFFQLKNFSDNWEEIQYTLETRVEEMGDYLEEKTPIPREVLPGNSINGDKNRSAEENQEQAFRFLWAVLGYMTQALIVMVYLFLFIHFRKRCRVFILRFFPKKERERASCMISKAAAVSRSYLAGKLLLMVFLTLLYFTGLYISGLENALFISMVAALLSIIPVVGNLFGYFIALAVALLSDGSIGTLIGITLTFGLAQFIDTYILQPIVLGNKVNVHPVFIILTAVLGYLVWGIIGLVLAIPLFGMIAVICRYIPALNPFGYLFSRNDIAENDIVDQD